VCVRHVGEWPFQVVFFVAQVIYFLAAWRLVQHLRPLPPVGGGVFALAFTVLHSGLARWASTAVFGEDYFWFFQCGLANQYLLGPGLQPSVVGVLLLVAVAEYAGGRPVRASAIAASTTLVHSTYLLPVALLVCGFGVHLLVLKQWKNAILSALAAVLLVSPAVIYILTVFAPTDAVTFAESQRILAEVRIPHHCRPARWFDWVAGLQIVWVLLGLVLLRKTQLLVPLSVVVALATVGTLAVIVTNHPTLSLLFPWRISAVLVPVSTAVVIRNLTPHGEGGVQYAMVSWPLFVLFLLFVVLSSAAVYSLHLGYRDPESETELLDHVAATRTDADVYLVPAKFPAASKDFTGVYSKTFTPPLPAFSDLARFRLKTDARLFVDFKSIPYHDSDVIEWHRRVSACERWYGTADWDTSGVINEVIAEGVTHVVTRADKPIRCVRLIEEVVTPGHRLYRVR
jgi:hypothetical protein